MASLGSEWAEKNQNFHRQALLHQLLLVALKPAISSFALKVQQSASYGACCH